MIELHVRPKQSYYLFWIASCLIELPVPPADKIFLAKNKELFCMEISILKPIFTVLS